MNASLARAEKQSARAAPSGRAAATRAEAATPDIGNLAIQSLFRARAVHAKLTVGRPDDPLEEEADKVADRVMRKPASGAGAGSCACAPGGELCEECQAKQTRQTDAPPVIRRAAESGAAASAAPSIVAQTLGGSGRALDASTRADMEGRFGRDFGDVRIHVDHSAAKSAAAIDALAYTAGNQIVFGQGRYAPQTDAGRRLLAHELAHTLQRSDAAVDKAADRTDGATGGPGSIARGLSASSAGRTIQRQPAGGGSNDPSAGRSATADPAAKPVPSIDIPLIPAEWVKRPGADDILTVVLQGRMVALPAAGSFVVLRPPPEGVQPTQPLVAVPTIGKEGMIAVNVGGTVGFQIDAGGEPIFVYPAAMAAIRQSLGVTQMKGAAVTHIHDDHVRSFVATIRLNSIRPEGLFFPAAFAVNAAAPGGTFAAALQAVKTDPSLRALGHGTTGGYQAIPTPAGGAFTRISIPQGEATLDFYALSQPFRDLEAQRAAGQKQPKADTASQLVRVSFGETGPRAIYLGDLRGADLSLFEQAMGSQAYDEMLQGVRVVIGFQHHMGNLESQADRDGLVRFLRATYLRTGELDVLVQSADRQGNFTLNRSLMSGLTGLGVNIHVAKSPTGSGAPTQVGTITYDSSGAIKISGAGEVESLEGSAEVRADINRLIRLNEASETLERYGRFVNSQYRYTDDVRKARDDLRSALDDYLQGSLQNVKKGASGRAQASLNNPGQQAQALQRVRASHPIEEKLTPAYMGSLRELSREGPAREIIETELAKAHTTGRMSPEGIEALWEVEPEIARRLVGESNLPSSVQRQTLEQLPGQAMPAGTRAIAGFMLAIEVAELAAPIVQSVRTSHYNDRIRPGLEDILWWQSKGVFPSMQAVNDRWWPRSNEWTTDQKRIQELIADNDLDYLVMTGIDDRYWDAFTIWASSHLISYPDWNKSVTATNAVRGTGANIQELTWSYRTGSIEGATIGFDMSEKWVESARLTAIMRAAADAMVGETEKQIQGIAAKTGPDTGAAYRRADTFQTREAFGDKPQATGKKRFKQEIDTPTLYTVYGHRARSGFDKNLVFYVFPNQASREEDDDIGAGYVVVGGANYNSYIQIYNSSNRVTRQRRDQYGMVQWYSEAMQPNELEVLLAKTEDLEDVPK